MLRYYQSIGIYPTGYALGSPQKDLDQINAYAEVVFICTPTPTDRKGEQDLSILYDVANKIKGNKIIVIRSTILPGTTDDLQKKFPNHQWLHNPEFLSEATCDVDFCNPDRQIIGYTDDSFDVAVKVADLLPPTPYLALLPAKAAELIKYIHNTWGTTQITFANQIYDLCEKLGIDYDRDIKPAIKSSKYTGPSFGRYYLDVVHKGKRGFKGTCYPKDLRAFVKMMGDLKLDGSLFKCVQDYNRKLLKSQGLKDD